MRSLETTDKIDDLPLKARIQQARHGNGEPLAELMRVHNQRLFRIARAILRDDVEAEDIVQEAFVKAFTESGAIRQANRISAWLSRTTANLALDRLRQKRRQHQILETDLDGGTQSIEALMSSAGNNHVTPESLAAMSDIRKLLEHEIDQLPDGFREVFVLRLVEQMSISETASALDIEAATVKTRLHRARTLLRKGLENRITALSLKAFPFGGKRCARTTEAVIARLQGVSEATRNSHH